MAGTIADHLFSKYLDRLPSYIRFCCLLWNMLPNSSIDRGSSCSNNFIGNQTQTNEDSGPVRRNSERAEEDTLPATSNGSRRYLNQRPGSRRAQRNTSWVPRGRPAHGYLSRYVKKASPDQAGPESRSSRTHVSEMGSVVGEVSGAADDRQRKSFDETKNILKQNSSHNPESSGVELDIKAHNGVSESLSKLQKIALAAAEVRSSLSSSRARINDEVQENEILALKSIFGDNIVILDRKEGLRSLQINVHFEAKNDFMVTSELAASSGLTTRPDNEEKFLYSFHVKHLQPMELTCLLPESYPSHQPPVFCLYAQWLIPAKVSELCAELDSIWMEQHGQEVIYQWVDWLQNSSLSYLEFDGEIKLGPYDTKYYGDQRALSGSVSPHIDIPLMQRYNEERSYEMFNTNIQQCCICYEESLGSEFVKLPCQHFFCTKCMKTYSGIHVSEGAVNKLLCPNTECGGMIPPYLLKRFLTTKDFERWESFMIQKTLDSMADVVYCPRCETPSIEDEEHDAQCSKCYYTFCTLCREKRHVGTPCLTPELKLQILRERQESTSLRDDQKRKELEMINNLLNVREALRDAKQCPSCQMAISKTEGCNKMVCSNCETFFCYNCCKVIDGYEHFRGGECQLFPHEEIARWEEQINPRQVVGQIQAHLFANNRHTCPNCAQFNVKMGKNNHIFCWACQVHYCYLCRNIVRKGSKHFAPHGCKQHTE